MVVDTTDIRILEHLNRDGRASLREIAEALGLSPSTVSNRFHALQEDGIIEAFRPVLNYEKIGFGLTALIEINIDTSQMSETANEIRELDRVISFFEVTGDTDVVIVCKFLDRADMNRFVKRLQKAEGVSATRTNVVLTAPTDLGTLPLTDAAEH